MGRRKICQAKTHDCIEMPQKRGQQLDVHHKRVLRLLHLRLVEYLTFVDFWLVQAWYFSAHLFNKVTQSILAQIMS